MSVFRYPLILAILAGTVGFAPATTAEDVVSLSMSLTTSTGDATELALAGSDNSDAEKLDDRYRIVTDPLEVDKPFTVAGVTWREGDSLPEGSSIELRTLVGSQWGQWFALESDEEGRGRAGTEPFVTAASRGIQVRLTKGSGALPRDMEISISYGDGVRERDETAPDRAPVEPAAGSVFDDVANPQVRAASKASVFSGAKIDWASALSKNFASPSTGSSSKGAEVAVRFTSLAQSAPQASAAALSAAKIQPRSAWGADPKYLAWDPKYADFEGVIVHHTASANNYTAAEVPGILRSIYYFHAVTRNWGDIGYNVIVDRFGRRWEGRNGTLSSPSGKMVIGAHAVPRNQGTMGVSVLGNFDGSITGAARYNSADIPVILQAIEDVAAWPFVAAHKSPSSTSPLTVPDTRGSLSSLPIGSPLPRIVGHRDVASTLCPADLYPKLDEVRRGVQQRYDAFTNANTSPQLESVSLAWKNITDAYELEAKPVVSGNTSLEYKWMYYDPYTGVWSLISDWSSSPKAIWKIKKNQYYWIHVEARIPGNSASMKSATEGVYYVVTPIDITSASVSTSVSSGHTWVDFAMTTENPAPAYNIAIYDAQKKAWTTSFASASARWQAHEGSYMIAFQSLASDGRVADQQLRFFSSPLVKNIAGTYIGSLGGRSYQLGIVSDNPLASYESLIYDVSAGTWIQQYSGSWPIWVAPRSGIYWVLFRMRDSYGEVVDSRVFAVQVN